MALPHSDLIRLLESLRSTDGIELVRTIAERMVQELIEAEATAHIGAEWNEHTAARTALRNGHHNRGHDSAEGSRADQGSSGGQSASGAGAPPRAPTVL